MGVNYPWIYKISDVVASLTLGQVTYSTQKNVVATVSGSSASVPTAFVDMHWEKILYIWNDTVGALVPQFGVGYSTIPTDWDYYTGPTWVEIFHL